MLVAALVAFGLSPRSTSATALLTADVRADADWILSSQLADGSIANYSDKLAVWPYLSNFAALGLVRATAVTGDKKYLNATWRWLEWYQAHQDARGFVTDYHVVNGQLVSTGFMDSTDSYAGTFLLAVREAYRQRGEIAKVKGLAAGITRAVAAIEATQQSDGLTWAKPSWRVKYLMDQAETYSGLVAASELARLIGNRSLADRATDNAKRMKAGVDALWNPATTAYNWAVHENGVRLPNRWSVLYSDSLQQAWAVAFGMVDPSRAAALAQLFTVSQPNWAKPLDVALFDSGTQTVGYWPMAGLGLRLAGNPAGALGTATIRAGSMTTGRAWPFTTGNAGQLILLESSGWTPPTLPTTTTTTSKPTTTTAKPTTTTAKPTTTTARPTTTMAPSTTTTSTAPPTSPTTAPAGSGAVRALGVDPTYLRSPLLEER